MTTYFYLKAPPIEGSALNGLSLGRFKNPNLSSHLLKFVSIFFLSLGVGLLSWLVWPFLEWQVIYAPRFIETEIIKPVPSARAELVQDVGDDLIYARNWFPQAPPQVSAVTGVGEYKLSIPKLKISNAQAIVGGEDLSKSLIHYGGTALPGENGVAVVFGHSVLPQFFNPKNYKSIFSTLHTLEEGDEILVNLDGVEYRYRIFGFEIVDPSDTKFLEQKDDSSYLYLVTCTPPGTYWKRLVVKSKIESLYFGRFDPLSS